MNPSSSRPLHAIVSLLRPRQWVKNGFVVAPLIFSREFVLAESWRQTAIATLCFCLASSAVYAINDLLDRDLDAAHPEKRLRPLASGTLPPGAAIGVLGVLLALIVILATPRVAPSVATFIAVGVLYAIKLKHIALVDLITVATGFLVRVWGGASAIDVPLTVWMTSATFFVALFLIAIKRREELRFSTAASRPVLQGYPPKLLSGIAALAGACAVAIYCVFALTTRPVLAPTIVLVLLGVARYAHLWRSGKRGEFPTETVLGDPWLMAIVSVWVAWCMIALRSL